jgi:hypothetical protein
MLKELYFDNSGLETKALRSYSMYLQGVILLCWIFVCGIPLFSATIFTNLCGIRLVRAEADRHGIGGGRDSEHTLFE